MPVQIKISTDAAPLQAVLDEISALLAELPEGSAERGNALIDLREVFDEGPLVDLDCDMAGAADHLLVRLQPSERLRGLVATLGAWNG